MGLTAARLKKMPASLLSLSIIMLFLPLTAKISTELVFHFLFLLRGNTGAFPGAQSIPLFTTYSIYFLNLGKMLT